MRPIPRQAHAPVDDSHMCESHSIKILYPLARYVA